MSCTDLDEGTALSRLVEKHRPHGKKPAVAPAAASGEKGGWIERLEKHVLKKRNERLAQRKRKASASASADLVASTVVIDCDELVTEALGDTKRVAFARLPEAAPHRGAKYEAPTQVWRAHLTSKWLNADTSVDLDAVVAAL